MLIIRRFSLDVLSSMAKLTQLYKHDLGISF